MVTIGSGQEFDIYVSPEVSGKKSAKSTPASEKIVVRTIVDIVPSLYANDPTRPLFLDKLSRLKTRQRNQSVFFDLPGKKRNSTDSLDPLAVDFVFFTTSITL